MRIDRLIARGPRDASALVYGDRALSYAALDDLVGQVAFGLRFSGVGSGDRVVIWAPKSIESVALMFAAARAGAVFVPAHPQLKAPQVAHIVADSGAKLVVTTAARAASLDVEAEVMTLESSWPRFVGGMHFAAPVADDDLAALLYTSGSTGRPKGVMLSHSNLWHAADAVRTYLGTQPDDRVLSVLPHGFDYGLNQLTQAWAAGASTVLLDYLTPRDIVRAVERHGITQLGGVPPLWHDLVAASWGTAGATLRTLTNSGGHVPPSLSARLRELFPQARLWLMYGLTEAFRASALDPALAATHPTSVGTAIPHARVGIARADGSAAADDEAGELVQAGPLVAQGYWGDAARTAARFRPAPAWLGGGPGVWSGDTLRRDATGLHYFVGRDDEQIKVNGHRISPTEIEAAAVASGVGHAMALGIPDARAGQAIVLIAAPTGDEAALRTHLARELPSYMQPAQIVWRDTLPVNANGKLDRAALRESL